MKIAKNQKIIVLLAMASIAVGAGAATSLSAFAEDAASKTSLENVTLTMRQGASVRIPTASANETAFNAQAGLRYEIQMSKDNYEAVVASEGNNVRFGVLIAPESYHTAHALNVESNLTGETAVYNWAVPSVEDPSKWSYTPEEGKKQIVNLDTNSMAISEDSSKYVWRASLVDVLPENITRKFIGIGYVYDKANDKYYFAEENDNARSMSYVAQMHMQTIGADTETYKNLNKLYVAPFVGNGTSYTVNHVKIDTNGTKTTADTQVVSENVKVGDKITATANEYEGWSTWGEMPAGVAAVNGESKLEVKYYRDNGLVKRVSGGYGQCSAERTPNAVRAKALDAKGSELRLQTKYAVEVGKMYKLTVRLQFPESEFLGAWGYLKAGGKTAYFEADERSEANGIYTYEKYFTADSAQNNILTLYNQNKAFVADILSVEITEVENTNVVNTTSIPGSNSTFKTKHYPDKTAFTLTNVPAWDKIAFETSLVAKAETIYKVSFKLKTSDFDAIKTSLWFYDNICVSYNAGKSDFLGDGLGLAIGTGANNAIQAEDLGNGEYLCSFTQTKKLSADETYKFAFKAYKPGVNASFDFYDLKIEAVSLS